MELRCEKCGKLLARVITDVGGRATVISGAMVVSNKIQIQCPKTSCKHLNDYPMYFPQPLEKIEKEANVLNVNNG